MKQPAMASKMPNKAVEPQRTDFWRKGSLTKDLPIKPDKM